MSAYQKPSKKEVKEIQWQRSRSSAGYQEFQALREKLKADKRKK